jgi:hypothetical protein
MKLPDNELIKLIKSFKIPINFVNMKRSDQPTAYIFIKADTQSEWDCCDFAIIKLTDQWRNEMRKRLTLLEPFKKDDSFYSHHYWDRPEGIYTSIINDDGEDIIDIILTEGEDWAFVTLLENELDTFPVPESRLDSYQLVLTKHGTARFKAYGKHTGEEFWTDDFDAEALINISITHEIVQ